MSNTYNLVTPEICCKYRTFIADKFTELGVKDARNIVGRIANLWFNWHRIDRSLQDWETNRRNACQNLSNTDGTSKHYDASDRKMLISDRKRAVKNRDEWHYKSNLYPDLNKMMDNLPTLYVTDEELDVARRAHIDKLCEKYRRKSLYRKRKRKLLPGRLY